MREAVPGRTSAASAKGIGLPYNGAVRALDNALIELSGDAPGAKPRHTPRSPRLSQCALSLHEQKSPVTRTLRAFGAHTENDTPLGSARAPKSFCASKFVPSIQACSVRYVSKGESPLFYTCLIIEV